MPGARDQAGEAGRSGGLSAALATRRIPALSTEPHGYSVFAVSHRDLQRLRVLQLQDVRAMQTLIAESAPGECVGLYCAQLLDLRLPGNTLR